MCYGLALYRYMGKTHNFPYSSPGPSLRGDNKCKLPLAQGSGGAHDGVHFLSHLFYFRDFVFLPLFT